MVPTGRTLRGPRRTRSARPAGSRPRLIAYVRVSTDEQAREGHSLDAQRARLAAYATAAGADLVGVEVDAGVSGAVAPASRPGLARALETLRRRDADGLLVTKLDRLSRRVADTLALIAESERQGWRLVSLSESLDTTTATGRLVVLILAGLAAMEREQVGERVSSVAAHLIRQGRVAGSRIPFGYRAKGSREVTVRKGERPVLVENPQEQDVLRKMLALRAEGFQAFAVASRLNRDGILHPRGARPWTRSAVGKILEAHDRRSAALGTKEAK